MRGGGTKLDTTANNTRPFCLDITRLLRRTGRVHTGVDRVEWAYLEWLLTLDRPVYGLVRSAFGYLVLDRAGLESAHRHLRDADWPAVDFMSRFALKLSPEQRGAESTLRKIAIARATPARFARMMRRCFPHGAVYFNTGHSNLSRRVLAGLAALDGISIAVLIHDTIPLDYPEFQRRGTVEPFRQKLENVARYADVVICNSEQTRRDIKRHMAEFGRVPPSFVAHLGVPVPQVGQARPVPTPYVITLGTIEPRKNHALLLDIWEAWQDAPHLVVCGNRGWNNEAVFARLDAAQTNGLPIIEINGASDEEVFALLKGASAALFPSLAEGYGLPPVEAAALGVPVICGDLAIYREVLGELPVYAATSDAYQWKKAIGEQLRKDSAANARAGTNELAYTPPSWSSHFNLVLNNLG